MLALADLYTAEAFDSQPGRARRFFCRHRGFGAAHGRDALPRFRELFLRVALGAAQRAAELTPESLECACLLCVVLWTLAGDEAA